MAKWLKSGIIANLFDIENYYLSVLIEDMQTRKVLVQDMFQASFRFKYHAKNGSQTIRRNERFLKDLSFIHNNVKISKLTERMLFPDTMLTIS